MELKNLVKGKMYRVSGNSQYFKNKYGTSNPEFRYEMTDLDAWGKCWADVQGNPCAMLFAFRAGIELPIFVIDETRVCYGHVKSGKDAWLAELVHPDELEETQEKS